MRLVRRGRLEMTMTADEFREAVYDAGWRDTADAQWEKIEELHARILQPTNQELSAAWAKAILLFDDIEGMEKAKSELRELRNRRTTYFGTSEVNLMIALDKFLDA